MVDHVKPFSSETKIPPPQFEAPIEPSQHLGPDATLEDLLAENQWLRDEVKRAGAQTYRVQSQLVFQMMYSRHLKATLYHKEQKGKLKKGRLYLLSRPHAWVLTGDEFTGALEEDEERGEEG